MSALPCHDEERGGGGGGGRRGTEVGRNTGRGKGEGRKGERRKGRGESDVRGRRGYILQNTMIEYIKQVY